MDQIGTHMARQQPR